MAGRALTPLSGTESHASEGARVALLVWAAWTGVALLFMLYVMLPSPAARDPSEWLRAMGWQLVSWWTWAAWTPVVVAVARQAMHLRSPVRLVAAHLIIGVAVSGLCTILQGGLRWVAFRGIRFRYDIAGASSLPLADEWSFNLVVYGLVVGAFYALRAGRLEAQLARSRLDALSARLRPHFLFNTLNTISALVVEDPKAANRMITQLAELLRQALDRGDEAGVTLEEELRLLSHYVAIQEQRFGDRLRVDVEMEPGAEHAMVPALLLQPLVENAVTHGLSGGERNGRVWVRVAAGRAGWALRLVVQDDGPGFAARRTVEGVGLGGTRARLEELYGSAHHLEVTNAPDGGALVKIEIPLATDAGADR